jgi:hypothetical protein
LHSTSHVAPLIANPENNPNTAAAHGATYAQGAVIATKPASAPLQISLSLLKTITLQS